MPGRSPPADPRPEAASLDDARLVRPDGLAIRARRHERGWSPRELGAAIRAAHERAEGLPATLRPAQLVAIEERNARIPYTTLCLIAAGLDCNPVEILAPADPGGSDARRGS